MSNLWLPGDDDDSIFNAASTYSNAEHSTDQTPDYEAMIEFMQEFRRKDDLRKSRAYFDILGMKCSHCDEAVEYIQEPELLRMCEHVYAGLRERCTTYRDHPGQHLSALL